AQLVDEDGIGRPQEIRILLRDLSENAYAQSRPRERMAIHHLARQAQLDTELAHLVLEQLPERFEELQIHLLGKTAHVVVALDDVRLTRLAAGGLDYVGIDRALREPLDAFELRRLLLEHFHEEPADDLALALRVHLSLECSEKALLGVDADDAHAHVLRERLHDLIALAEAQQSMIDEHASELISDRAMQQRSKHRGIDAARQPQQHAVGADLLANAGDRIRDDVARLPTRFAAADLAHEAFEHLRTLARVSDFRVKLNGIVVPRFVGHCRERHRIRERDRDEARRQLIDPIAMTHPHIEGGPALLVRVVGKTLEEPAWRRCRHARIAELAVAACGHAPAELLRHRVHPVANTEHGNAELEHRSRCTRRRL